MADQPELNWSAAKVSDRTLTVAISGETDDDWGETFSRTVALLSSGGAWGKVAFDSDTVTVEEVQEGSEENLRFALDGAVQEANAHHVDSEAQDDGTGDDEATGEDDDGSDADRRMADRFRDAD